MCLEWLGFIIFPTIQTRHTGGVSMRKLKALFLAFCLVLAILIFNIPRVNFGQGSGFESEQSYTEYAGDYSKD